jgi:hypothetical protein
LAIPSIEKHRRDLAARIEAAAIGVFDACVDREDGLAAAEARLAWMASPRVIPSMLWEAGEVRVSIRPRPRGSGVADAFAGSRGAKAVVGVDVKRQRVALEGKAGRQFCRRSRLAAQGLAAAAKWRGSRPDCARGISSSTTRSLAETMIAPRAGSERPRKLASHALCRGASFHMAS